jgi:hypothetical protein
MGRGENALISITNPDTGESQWVRLRDERAKWYVESINPKTRSVVVLLNNMSVKLEMITTAGDGTPETIRPQPTQIAAAGAGSVAEGPGSGDSSSGSASFDPKSIASQMLALRAGGQASTPEQAQALMDQMRSLSSEQRQQVFEQVRARRTGGDSGSSETQTRRSDSVAPSTPAKPEAPALRR